MKRTTKKKIFGILSAAFALTVGLGALASCGGGGGDGDKQPPEYEYQYNRPFSSVPDDFMTLDGLLKEDEWQDQNYIEHYSDGAGYKFTTLFTESGFYLGGYAEDPYVYWKDRYNFANSTHFEFIVVPSYVKQTQDDVDNRREIPKFQQVRLQIDPLSCRSYRETRYAAASHVGTVDPALDGQYNTSKSEERIETTSFSVEIFITWEEFYRDENYRQRPEIVAFEEDGVNFYEHEDFYVKVFGIYRKIDGVNKENKINVWLQPFTMQSLRLATFYEFDKKGTRALYDSEFFGNPLNGPAMTDRWIVDDDEGTAEVTYNRTQIAWMKDQPASDYFSIEATITPGLYDGVDPETGWAAYQGPKAGFMIWGGAANYKLFINEMRQFSDSGDIRLRVGTRTDGLQWLGMVSLDEVVHPASGLDSVTLKLIKYGNRMYYFYNGNFWNVEDVAMGTAFAGIFTNGAVTFSDVVYEDYTDNEEELLAEISEHVYFISVSTQRTYGSLSVNKTAVKKGSPVDLKLVANSGAVLTDITCNGVSFYNELSSMALGDGCTYRFTPNQNNVDENGGVEFKATFEKFENEDLRKVKITIKDNKGAQISGIPFVIKDELGKLYYSETSVAKIIMDLPMGNAKGITLTGKYTLYFEQEGFLPIVYNFDVNDSNFLVEQFNSRGESKGFDFEAEIRLTKVNTGSVGLNGSFATEDAIGALTYDSDRQTYYHKSQTSGNKMMQYYYDSVSKNYAIHVKLDIKSQDNTSVPGIAISPGGAGNLTVQFKVAPWAANTLYFACGRNGNTEAELSIPNFTHTFTTTAASSNVEFYVVRYNNAMYVYNAAKELMLILSETGYQALGDRTVGGVASHGEAFLKNIKLFFNDAIYPQNAFGPMRYYSLGTGKLMSDIYYDITYNTSKSYVETNFINKLATISLNVPASNDYTAEVDGVETPLGFIPNTKTYVKLTSKRANQVISKATFTFANGSQTLTGTYDYENECTVFTMTPNANLTGVTVTEWANLGTVTGQVSSTATGEGTITFTASSGAKATALIGSDGRFSAKLLYGTYDVFAMRGGEAAFSSVTVNAVTTTMPQITLEKATYMIGDVTLNGNRINSRADATLRAQSLQGGAITIPGSSTLDTMANYLPNTTVTGADSFTWSISSNMAVTGADVGATQIGIGLTDGAYWWVFMLKQGEGGGSYIIAGFRSAGAGGNDSVIRCSNPNTVTNGVANITLTIVKTADKLELWAGGVLVLTASATDGYELYGATTNNSNYMNHKNSWSNFFDPNKQIAACYASMDYRASYTVTPEYHLDNQTATLTGAFTTPTSAAISNPKAVLVEDKTGVKIEVPVSVSGLNYTIANVPCGKYNVQITADGLIATVDSVTITSSTTTLGTIEFGSAAYVLGTVNVNNFTHAIPAACGITSAVVKDAMDGKFVLPAPLNPTSAFIGLPNTKVKGTALYDITIKLTGENVGRDSMMGIGISVGNAWWHFSVKEVEGGGQYLIVGYFEQHGRGGKDSVLRCVNTNSISGGVSNATIRIVKNARNFKIYMGANADELIFTVQKGSSEGAYELNGSWTWSNTNYTSHPFDAFFDADTEQVLGLATQWYNTAHTIEIIYNA